MIFRRFRIAPILSGLLLSAQAGAACIDGEDHGYACSHVDFVAHLSPGELGGPGEVLNDIWGWTDPVTGEEYALVGMYGGTAFVRLHGDGAPQFLGRLPSAEREPPIGPTSDTGVQCHDECGGMASDWRDIKTVGNFALIVSEESEHGIQVFDLTRLRGVDTARDWNMDGSYTGFGNAHNIAVNEARERAYAVGTGLDGGLHMLDVSDPRHPVHLASIDEDGYTHDAQCVNHAGPDADVTAGADICFAANEDTLTIWNVSDPLAPVMLSRRSYPDGVYAHQAWLSEDQRFLFLNDELDEHVHASRTRTRVFDVADLNAPEIVATYFAPTLSLDHNNYVHGRFLFQSNYTAGLRVLDILDPAAPVEAAYFDTQPDDEPVFEGTWSNYPWFASGLVALSDINDGLFVLRPQLDAVADADLRVQLNAPAEVVPGGTADIMATIENAGAAVLEDVAITIHLPSATRFLSASSADAECSAPERVVQCRVAALQPAAQVAVTLTHSSAQAGTFHVIAMAYARQTDAIPANNLAEQLVVYGERDADEPGEDDGHDHDHGDEDDNDNDGDGDGDSPGDGGDDGHDHDHGVDPGDGTGDEADAPASGGGSIGWLVALLAGAARRRRTFVSSSGGQ